MPPCCGDVVARVDLNSILVARCCAVGRLSPGVSACDSGLHVRTTGLPHDGQHVVARRNIVTIRVVRSDVLHCVCVSDFLGACFLMGLYWHSEIAVSVAPAESWVSRGPVAAFPPARRETDIRVCLPFVSPPAPRGWRRGRAGTVRM